MDKDLFLLKSGLWYYKQLPILKKKDDFELKVKPLRQTMSYTCGFIATLMAISFHKKINEKRLAAQMKINKDSASETMICNTVRKNGLVCCRRKGLTFKNVCDIISSGNPIICSNQNDWHWIVISGFNKTRKEVIICGDTPRRQKWEYFKKDGGARGGSIIPKRAN